MGKFLNKFILTFSFSLVLPILNCGDLELEESEADETSHYAGENCGSCHGTQATRFSVSGTIYTDASGTIPATGEIVIIKDINGNEVLRLTSDSIGNFYTNATLVYPARAETINGGSMTNSFDLTGSSCNQSGCHDSSQRIY